MSGAKVLAWTLFAVSNAGHVAGWVLVAASEVPTPALDVAASAALVLLPAVGAVVASRRPGNAIGWLLSGAGVVLAAAHVTYGWAAFVLTADRGLPGGVVAAWATNWLYLPGLFGVPPLLFLLFPDGRPLSRRWGWAVALTGAALVSTTAAQAVTRGPLVDSPVPEMRNPYTVDPALAGVVGGIGWTMLVVAIALAGWSLVLRYRRASGEARLQLRWVALSAGLFAVACLVSALLYPTSAAAVGPFLVVAAYITFPVAAGVAILRYRLYDIDLVINRALVYGSLTALLAALYLGSVLLLQVLFEPVTARSDLAVAASTLAVAAAFRPARARVQALVDRRFYRRRYDAARTLESFTRQLRHEVDLDSVTQSLRTVVQDTVQPAHVSLWVRSVP